MLKNIGTTELIIIAVVLLLLFGGKKLPELGRGLGDAIKEFRNAFKGTDKKGE
ncbi:MAG: twin-arginine translocase TatA/TatE family subunit [Candidatus Blackburnbacteria bacterium]|nr:twin-arginine translocase TatA/TatE family subunit [Candidatus Blackburnbacteria bacterium]